MRQSECNQVPLHRKLSRPKSLQTSDHPGDPGGCPKTAKDSLRLGEINSFLDALFYEQLVSFFTTMVGSSFRGFFVNSSLLGS
jgi:hypothetical protein